MKQTITEHLAGIKTGPSDDWDHKTQVEAATFSNTNGRNTLAASHP